MESNIIMALKLLLFSNVKHGFFVVAFIAVFIFTPLFSSANPFVDYGAGGRAAREGVPGALPPPLPDYSPSQPAFHEAVKEETGKNIDVLGFIGGKVVVSVNGKVSVVSDGTEIGGCLIAFPEVLCTDREKERHRKGQNTEKFKEGKASINEKTLTHEKKAVPRGLP